MMSVRRLTERIHLQSWCIFWPQCFPVICAFSPQRQCSDWSDFPVDQMPRVGRLLPQTLERSLQRSGFEYKRSIGVLLKLWRMISKRLKFVNEKSVFNEHFKKEYQL